MRFPRYTSRLLGAVLIPALLSVGVPAFAQSDGAKPLFGAYGSVGVVPRNPPPDFESWFAVAVVEVDSPAEIAKVALADLELTDRAGRVVKYKRLVSVEEFNRVRVATEGECAYWTNAGGTRPWDGTLPRGSIRLRVRVALAAKPPQWDGGVAFKLILGQHVIAGQIGCEWPS